ncbi:NAD-glutamate dehydrogenase [Nesterenkonia populi]
MDLHQLLRPYYSHIAEEDLAPIPEQERLERLRSHVETAQSFAEGEPALAVRTIGTRSIVQLVTRDMPYLVDSVTVEIARAGHAIALVVHPILLTERDDAGQLLDAREIPSQGRSLSSGDTQTMPSLAAVTAGSGKASVESWIAVELDAVLSDEAAEQLLAGIRAVLEDVEAAHRDAEAMRLQAHQAAAQLRQQDRITERTESAELLDWMAQGHFLFLGYREYSLTESGLEPITGTGLGILADIDGRPRPKRSSELASSGPSQEKALVITKADARSTVRRRTYMDYIAVKTYEYDGTVLNLTGERRFLGLFSQRAYTSSITTIPLLRSRAKQLLARTGFSPESHSGSDLMQILETYPRNELLQMDIDEVEETAWQILQLQERRRVRLFLREDHYGRFMTALVFLPRDRYNTGVRRRLEAVLAEHIDAASIDFTVRLSDSVLARVLFRIRLNEEPEALDVSTQQLQEELARAVRSWSESLAAEAAARYGRRQADRIAQRWAEAFPEDYRVIYEVTDALDDAAEFETLEAESRAGPRLAFAPPQEGDPADLRLKIYLAEPKTLTDTLPIIDDFGLAVLDERAYTVTTADGTSLHLYDLGLRYPDGVDPQATLPLFKEAYRKVLTGQAESDVFSRLVLTLGLSILQVTVLRAYAKYMRQLGSVHSYDFLAEALDDHPEAARALMSYFTARFDPDLSGPRDHAEQACRATVLNALEEVSTLDADRVLSGFLNLIEATDRTSLYQGHERVSFKLRPQDITAAPHPRPAHEIWVYSTQVEGSHLRYDAISRGGLRWSDRAEDFRTEVLGLVKAQMAKNAVIVPSGAKGAFYPKQLPESAAREEIFEAGREAYRTFIRALLDITDNQKEGDDGTRVLPPERVVRQDGDDPYLVVAADKGTATFSDTANEISAEYGHWLGDAFASGGSAGYDHKAMGITARGAWESVKAHFATLGHDTQSQDFTVIGIGDMGGDVFGNGMLLSEHIRLTAVFNHLHIFIDPDPDPAASFAERQRLLTAEKRGWDAYDASLISEGGGVFSRQARSIGITPQMRDRFGIAEDVEALTPPELVRALLTAPADLLYNGGIGTYVKAVHETHEQVGDRANNLIRVDGVELRARVVAEGGNLGLTQAGRIEAAQHGVLLNNDAVDNSAGVDCSDHEVNIKILLDRLVASGHLQERERSPLLQEMTDEVAELVLATNRDQNVLLLIDRQRIADWSPSFGRLIGWLEETVGLDRQLEEIPAAAAMEERADAGVPPLTAPELSVLQAYTKIQLKQALAASELPADPWFEETLAAYFPARIRERFGEQLIRHPLAHRMIATILANDAVNMGGSTFVFRTMEETFAPEDQVLRAFVTVRELFGLDEYDAALRRMQVSLPTGQFTRLYMDMRRFVDRAVRWFLARPQTGRPIAEEIEAYKGCILPLYQHLTDYLGSPDVERLAAERTELISLGLDEDLAAWTAELFESFPLLDVATLTQEAGAQPQEAAAVYYRVYTEFEVEAVLRRISSLPRQDKWQALARGAQRDELYSAIREIAEAVLTTTDPSQAEDPPADAAERLRAWKQAHRNQLERAQRLMADLQDGEDSLASITVLLRHLRGLVSS